MDNIEGLINRRDFEETALPHRAYLYNYALHLTKNSEDAKDLVQETYFRAFRFWHKFGTGSNIKAWLYQIMKNSYINMYRKRVREPRQVEYHEEKGHVYYGLSGKYELQPQQDMSYKDLFEDEIASSLESLPADFQNVVLLCDYQNLSYEEIAAIVDCPIGTVRSRLHRGRRHLQKMLTGYAKNHGYI